jgi:transcriptional regulator with XRE-family HTH domain
MKIQEIIQDLIEENDLSQEQFAKRIGVSQKAVSNWINGVDVPKASSLLAIYEKFGITPNELLGIEERKF